MKNAIFITVRTDSSRLPNKALLKILDRPIIEHVMLRAKKADKADTIVLCTTERPIDDEIVKIAISNGIGYFRGSLEDKLDRWHNAASTFNIDYFITMDGDDLLCDPELINLGIDQMEREGCDFIKAPEGLICGSFTYAIRADALKKVCEIKGTADTEMMWVYFEKTGLFNIADLYVNESIYFNKNIRLTLDYQEDFEFFKTVFEIFNNQNNDTPLRIILNYLNMHPDIAEINSFRQQDYLDNQKKKVKFILK